MMELQELKNAWAEYDKKLSENLKVNEELLKRMNLDKSKKEINAPMYLEISSVMIMILLIIAPMFFYGIYMIHQPIFSILSFVCVGVGVISMIISSKIIKTILKIEYYKTPVVQLQQQITSLKVLTLKYRKVEYILAVILILAITPVLMKWIHNFDVFTANNLLDPILRVIIGATIGFPLAIWLNKHFYDKKIENAQYHLKEIEKFSKEEQ